MPRAAKTKAALFIIFVAVIIYSNSLGGTFVYDDEYFVVRNVAIRSLANLPLFFTASTAVAFAGLSQDVYRPLATLSFALDYHFWKLNTFGYHLVNVLLHSLNAVLVFLVLFLIFGDFFVALASSLFFVSHPVQTEVVSWISGRSSVLFLFFYLAAFASYVLSVKRGRAGYYILSLFLFILSLLSKEMAVTLPLLIIAYDLHFTAVRDRLKKNIIRYLPYIALAAAFVAARSVILAKVSQCGWWGGGPYQTFLTMTRALAEYIRLLIMPVKLCAFYVFDVSTSLADRRVIAAIALLVILASSLPFVFRRARRASFAIWWFIITLIPVLNIVPLKALIAERFLYLPSIGFCLLLALALGWSRRFRRFRLAAAIAVAAIVLAYSSRTFVRNNDWKDTLSISLSILKVSPMSPWGLASAGVAYGERGEYDKAIPLLQKAITLSQTYTTPRTTLAFSYIELGRYDEAAEQLNEVLRLKPNDLEALNTLGVAYAKMKLFDKAAEQFKKSIRLDPTYVHAYLNLGSIYEQRLEYDKAIGEYDAIIRVTRSDQEHAMAFIRMGDAYLRMGDKSKSASCYEKAALSCNRGLDELKKIALLRLKSIR